MNTLIRFKMRILIVLMFCVFMTFSMLVYVMKLTGKCENEFCIQIGKSPVYKPQYFYYNFTDMSSQMLKPSMSSSPAGFSSSTLRDFSSRRTSRDILRLFSLYNMTLGSHIASRKEAPLSSSQYAVSRPTSPSSVTVASDPVVNEEDAYIERRENLQTFCRKYFNFVDIRKAKKIKLNHILIDEKHKLLYCYVPKVACTNWKRIFLVLTGKAYNISEVINLPSSEIHAKNLFASLQNYTIPEVLKMTQEYTKFIFVRHPFERLLSAYRNKLEQHYDSSKYFQARFGKFIIKNFRKNPSNASLERGDDVTFAEFVNYLISSDPTAYNEHWQRVTDLCHPCLINYDFIGKYETLIKDSNYLLRHLGMNVSFPVLPKPSTTATNLKKYYNTLGKSAIYKLYSIYQMDFRLFGYDLFNTSDWSNNS